MAWTQIPNFGDRYAKINERMHSSGARVIEVLYGARDGEGRPIPPENRSVDGHGHWIALEIEGTYQMLLWRHPASEGGQQEYGRSGSANPLSDLERDILSKDLLCTKAESMASSQNTTAKEFSMLFEEWKKIFNWRTPREQQLWERFHRTQKSFYERRDREREKHKTDKQRIIEEARLLSSSSDWQSAGQRMNELFDQWKAIGSAGKTEDESLWNEFNSARQTFRERRTRFLAEKNLQQENNKRQKQALISEARSITSNCSNWKSAGEQLRDLMERWKSIGNAGKEQNDRLWNEFNGIQRDFYNRRHAFYENQERMFRENANQKNRIVQEASGIASSCDYSSSNTERMKELDREWKTVGFSGKENEDRLWNMFQNAKDSFWSGKRASGERRQQEWRARQYEVIARKQDQISNLRNQISNLHDKMYGMKNQEYIDNMCRWIDEKEEKIRDLERDIYDIESRL